MARVNAGRSRGSNHPNSGEGPDYLRATQRQMDEIARLMPPQAFSFLLERRRSPITLQQFAWFWSHPTMCEYTRGEKAGAAAGASWFLAMRYLTQGKVPEAGALTLNGCFLYQCLHTHIETIVEMCGENFSNPVRGCKLPLVQQGFDAIQTPHMLKHFLKNNVPDQYRGAMSYFDELSSADEKMEYVGNISDAWKSCSTRNPQMPASRASAEARIQLILVDDTNDDRRHIFNIGSSTALKVVFNDYAEKRGVSLRSLRFSHRGRTLFLSCVGNKTPDELNLGDHNVINVIDTSAPTQEPSSISSNQMKKKARFRNRPRLEGRHKSKVPTPREEPVETLEQFKTLHSKMLTKLHEELQPRLKEIRNRLNALALERQPRKKKIINRKMKTKESTYSHILPNPGTRGKAGKPYFIIQVGEVENLYKTNKSCQLGQPGTSATVDLHGCSKNQALITLNEKLPEWVESAMNGEYPWVITVQIICGCGNQVLSDVVHEWIKSTRNVSNAPKNRVR